MRDRSGCEFYDGRCRIAGNTAWGTLVVRDVGREDNPCLYEENPQQESCPRPGTTRPPIIKGMRIRIRPQPRPIPEHPRKQ